MWNVMKYSSVILYIIGWNMDQDMFLMDFEIYLPNKITWKNAYAVSASCQRLTLYHTVSKTVYIWGWTRLFLSRLCWYLKQIDIKESHEYRNMNKTEWMNLMNLMFTYQWTKQESKNSQNYKLPKLQVLNIALWRGK